MQYEHLLRFRELNVWVVLNSRILVQRLLLIFLIYDFELKAMNFEFYCHFLNHFGIENVAVA